VKELVFRAAKRLAIETVLVANQRLQTPPGNPLVSAVRVDGGPDVADQYIATHASAGDLVVTQDVPLAALLVPRAVAVLDPRGEEHTDETIGERRSGQTEVRGCAGSGADAASSIWVRSLLSVVSTNRPLARPAASLRL
jgi:uncharacterized protein YaiI (UPF0178 family)